MKNKKGFTLVELLATIAIMASIATMVSINVVDIFNEKKKASENSQKNIIEEAACVYLNLSQNKDLKANCKKNDCSINASNLIAIGLLKEEDVDNNVIISITYKNNEKLCKI